MPTPKYGLLGRYLAYSFSPQIHAAMSCPEYECIELEPEAIDEFMTKREFTAINVTIPYKRTVMPYLDRISPEARKIGSVNTVINRAGRLYGYNTDYFGFKYMAEKAGISFEGKKILVLGSGGTSFTARAVAKDSGSGQVVLISRTGDNNYKNLDRHTDASVIVNCTPVGVYPNCPAAPISLRDFPNLTGVIDVNYNPLRTGLLMEAEELGIPHAGGLTMLVAQAKAAEEHFFSTRMDNAIIGRITAALRRDKENIILIGMPGAGKSTVGRELAELSGRKCIDIDRKIIKEEGRSIQEIFDEEGEGYFRALETESLRAIGKWSGVVIACGGGAVTREENYPLLHQNGRIYQIGRPLEELSTSGRPLSRDAEALAAMYEKRGPMYERFRDAYIENVASSKETAEIIWRDFNAYFGT